MDVRIRLTAAERERVRRVAEELGISLSGAYRQALNLLYNQMFREKPKPEPDPSKK